MEKELQWLLREKYGGKESKDFWRDASRIRRGQPVDYVIGFTEFLGRRIDLSLRPLIPRPETEYWAEQLQAEVKKRLGTVRFLDLFCGSGCVGVAMLASAPNLLCDFADMSLRCLKQTEVNAKRNGIARARYRLRRSNIFSGISGTYDFIAANPPYIPGARRNKVPRSVLDYEPHRALFGGADGLRFIKQLLSYARRHLKPGGQVWLEFDPHQKPRIAKFAKELGYARVDFFRDQFGRWRWVVVE